MLKISELGLTSFRMKFNDIDFFETSRTFVALKIIFPQAIGVNQSVGEENTRHIDPSPSIRELMVFRL